MIKNTDTSYGWLTKTFHWTMALLVITLLIVGNVMVRMENSPDKFEIYSIHKSVGLLVLALAVARLCWRIINVEPTHAQIAYWQKLLAYAVHWSLYACMILQPLIGWAMTSASGRTLQFFGLFTIPPIANPDETFATNLVTLHWAVGWTIVALLCAHIGGALLHHFYFRDNILKRMLPAAIASKAE